MSKYFQPTNLAGAIAIVLTSTTTFAADQTIELDPIVVTASKSEEKASEVPARISVISKDELEKNPALNLSDVLQKDASIYIKQSGGIGQISDISLRGTSAVHTLVLQNGARLNNQNNYAPLFPAFLDLSNISQIEILKGPASVQYGSDAIGGVVNLITAPPSKSGAQLTGVYGENNTYKAIINTDFVDNSGFYAQVGGQRLETDGTTVLNTQEKNEKAGYDQKGYHAKLGYIQDKKVDASIEINQNEGTSIFTNDYIVSNSPRIFKNQVINAKLAYTLLPNLKLSTRYSNIKDEQNVPDYGSHYNTENNEADVNLKWDFLPYQNILFGVNYLGSQYESNTITNAKQDVDSTGYYLQHQYKNDGVSTQIGARVEDNERFGTHTVGQAAVRFQILPLTSIYANIGSAFRAPSLNELYSQWGGNPELDPEKSVSYEIGLDQKLNYGLSASLSGYYTDVKNLITSDPSTFLNSNIEKAKMTGGELGFKWVLNRYYANAQYNYVKTENKDTGLEIAYRPRQTGTLTLGYDDGVYGVSTSLIARSKANSSNNNSNNKVPGYASVDFNAFWNINSNIKLFTNVQNIGDVRFKEVYNSYPFTSWYINGGRQASIGVTLKY